MRHRRFFICEKIARPISQLLIIATVCAMVANAQKAKCKKWTYDFSETVKFFDTSLEACKSYVKDKYPKDKYRATVEAASDPEMNRCSADETYVGIVYKRECDSCCNKPSQVRQSQRATHAINFLLREKKQINMSFRLVKRTAETILSQE